ncbi:MAG: hypothetical protein P8Z81_12065, partial [Deinococcales bacterium]
ARAELSRVEREYALFREQFRGMLEAYARSLESQPHPREAVTAAPRGESGSTADGDEPTRAVETASPSAH